MLRKLTPWLFLLVALSGCGSSQDFTATTNPSGTLTQGRYFTQVYLENIDSSSQLEVQANGRTLATLPAGNGTFELPSDLPGKFTLVARMPARQQSTSGAVALRKNVDLSDPAQQRFIVINVISHLTALLQEIDPSLSLAQAQQRVRTGLAIPPTIPTTDMLSNLPESPFSHREFLRQAGLNGGVEAFSRQVAQDIASGKTRTFTEPTLQLGVDPGEAILGGLLGNVCATPFTLVETQAIGWAAGKMGFQNSTEKQLDSIADQLTELSAQITALSNQLALQGVSSLYTQDQTALSAYYAPALSQTYGPPNSSGNNTTGLVPTINSQAPSYVRLSSIYQTLMTGS